MLVFSPGNYSLYSYTIVCCFLWLLTILDLCIGTFTIGNTFSPRKKLHQKSFPQWWCSGGTWDTWSQVPGPGPHTPQLRVLPGSPVPCGYPGMPGMRLGSTFFIFFWSSPETKPTIGFIGFLRNFPCILRRSVVVSLSGFAPWFQRDFFPIMCFQCCELWKQGVWRFEPFSDMQVLKMTFLLWQP